MNNPIPFNLKKLPSLLPLSDTHFEWDVNLIDYSTVINKKVADIIILAGDIAAGTKALPFILHLIRLGYKVVYILGNHEYYKHDIYELQQEWRNIAKNIEHLYFLENESVVIDGVEFIGSTLWTSLNTKDKSEEVDFYIKQAIKRNDDFFSIKNFSVTRMKDLFHDSWEKVQKLIENPLSEKRVFVCHYLPTEMSIHPAYKNSILQNYMFYTELSNYLVYSSLNLIIHGHTHSSFDYMLGNKRVICNPRGYHDLKQVNDEFTWTNKVITDY